MIDQLEALAALARHGTMTRAATALRISQGGLSKRIAGLEARLGRDLIEPEGRGVRLTTAGQRLVDRSAPLLAGLRAALTEEEGAATGTLRIAVSESILASWGAPALVAARDACPGVELRLAAHRSPVALDRLRAGEVDLALCAGVARRPVDLEARPVLDEEMVVVPAGLGPLRLRRGRRIEVLSIEPASATWRVLEGRLRRLARERGIVVRVAATVESFAAVVQLARHGLGHGLAPLPLCRALGVASGTVRLPGGLERPVQLLARRSTLARQPHARFARALIESSRRAHATSG